MTGDALKTVIALRGFQKGDLLRCSTCLVVHIFDCYVSGHPDGAFNVTDDRGGGSLGGMDKAEVSAWKPMTKAG